jgi:hypothetical protein
MHQLAVTLLTAKLYATNAYVINDEDAFANAAFEKAYDQYGEEFEHVIERIMFDGEKPDIQTIFKEASAEVASYASDSYEDPAICATVLLGLEQAIMALLEAEYESAPLGWKSHLMYMAKCSDERVSEYVELQNESE